MEYALTLTICLVYASLALFWGHQPNYLGERTMMQDNETLEVAELEYDVGGMNSTEPCDEGTYTGIIYFVPPR